MLMEILPFFWHLAFICFHHCKFPRLENAMQVRGNNPEGNWAKTSQASWRTCQVFSSGSPGHWGLPSQVFPCKKDRSQMSTVRPLESLRCMHKNGGSTAEYVKWQDKCLPCNRAFLHPSESLQQTGLKMSKGYTGMIYFQFQVWELCHDWLQHWLQQVIAQFLAKWRASCGLVVRLDLDATCTLRCVKTTPTLWRCRQVSLGYMVPFPDFIGWSHRFQCPCDLQMTSTIYKVSYSILV